MYGNARRVMRDSMETNPSKLTSMWKRLFIPLLAAFLLPSVAIADPSTSYTGGQCTCRCPNGRTVTVPSCYKGNECYAACGVGNSSGNSSGSTSAGELGAAIGTVLGNAIANSIRGNPEEEATRKAQQEAQAAEQKRKAEEQAAVQKREAEEQARQDEETKERLLGSMKGIDSSSQLGLMGVDAAPDLQLMTSDQAVSASPGLAKPDGNNSQIKSPSKSVAFTKGYDDASQCYSQNSGSCCAGLAGEEWQACLTGYRAGFQVGDKERQLLMQQAWQAGKLAAAKGELANGASDPLADGPCRVEWIQTYNKGYFQGKPAPLRATKPANVAAAKVDSEETRVIKSMNALAKQLGLSVDEQKRINDALNDLEIKNNEPVSDNQINNTWDDIVSRSQNKRFTLDAAQVAGPVLPSAGVQAGYQDCAIFALANASGQPYGVVAARATKLISEGEWRNAAERKNPQKAIEEKGLNGGEVVLLAETFGMAKVVHSADFAKTINDGSPVLVNVVPKGAIGGHEIVLTRTFQRGGKTWYEMIDSKQGPQERSYLSHKELSIIIQENGVAFSPDSRTTPKLLR